MKGIVVLGCYRSGSSAVAGILHHLGIFMGEQFDPPSRGNPRGYFEDVEFKDLHKQMMEGEDIRDQYRSLVKSRKQGPLWGLKDPRLCLLLPRLPLDPSYVICTHRDPSAIAASLCKVMETHPADKWMTLVEHYLERRDEWLMRYNGVVMSVRFEELMQNPYRTVQAIASFVSVPFQKTAVDFISSS
jgi:hypothetical protein